MAVGSSSVAVPLPSKSAEGLPPSDPARVHDAVQTPCVVNEMAGQFARTDKGGNGAIATGRTTGGNGTATARAATALSSIDEATALTAAGRVKRIAQTKQTTPTLSAAARRERTARHIGAGTAAQLGSRTTDYTTAELIALGAQIITDRALHGDDIERAQLLVRLSKAAEAPQGTGSAPDGADPPADNADGITDQVSEFLLEEYKEELAVSHAAADLAALRKPTRPALARELLAHIGLNPERVIDTLRLVGAGNPTAGNDPIKAADYYLAHGKLSAADIRGMADGELTDLEVQVKLAALPDSLDAEFARRFDTYTRAASDKTIALFDSWLLWIGRTLSSDLNDARVEVHTAQLEYFMIENRVVMNRMVSQEGRTRKKVPAAGYIATIHARGAQHRYFLSTLDGGIHLIPSDMSASDWIAAQADTVFGLTNADTGSNPDQNQNPKSPNLQTRVALTTLSEGTRADLHTWLAVPLQGHHDQARATARAQTMAEHLVDTMLDFIPFRRMVVSLREGDVGTALRAGAFDIMTLAIPMLCPGLRLTSGIGRGLLATTRKTGGELAASGMGRAGAMTIALSEMRNRIREALQSLSSVGGIMHELKPLDTDSIAAALRHSHPRLARALARRATRARGTSLREGGWRVPDSTAAHPTASTEIGTLAPVTARAADNSTLSLLPYGNDAVRAYTRIDHAGRRTGSVLVADSEGWLYPSLPVDTLERYRVKAVDLLHELGTRRPGANGVIEFGGRQYARIADEYVEIVHERASVAAVPVWRVVAPNGVRRDIVIHRISHDGRKGLWRRANVPGLKGWGRDALSSPGQSSSGHGATERASAGQASADQASAGRASTVQASTDHASTGQASRNRPSPPPASPTQESPVAPKSPSESQLRQFQQHLLSRIAGTTLAARVDAVRNVLSRLQSDPRGQAILNAMYTCQEILGRSPNIVLLDGANTSRLRPSLTRPTPGTVWNLDVDALSAGTVDDAVNELAAVYNNMTGILHDVDPFSQAMRAGQPRLDAKLEAAWKEWVGTNKGSHSSTPPRIFIPSPRQAAVDRIRTQLRMARCYGGLNKATLIDVLKGGSGAGIRGLKVDLSALDLTELPVLPVDVLQLDVCGNPITDWSRLPPNLKVLNASQTRSVDTLLDHLPSGLEELDLSHNGLEQLAAECLPRGLRHLELHDNWLHAVPSGLPDTLQVLVLSDNCLRGLSVPFPRGLRTLDLSSNELDYLPLILPPDLEYLDLSDNAFTWIPDSVLPPRLETLDLSENSLLDTLPTLPGTVRALYLESCGLTSLPENLPAGLRVLHADDLELSRLPDNLPRGLSLLTLRFNQLSELPATIVELASCDIYLEGNPISASRLPPLPAGQRGPAFHLSIMAPQANIGMSRTVVQAVGHWFEEQESEVVAKWRTLGEQLEASAATRRSATGWKRFLDRLRGTRAYDNPEFRADIREWLTELSKPERKALLTSTLEMCEGATESCDDRIAFVLTELRTLRIHDDVRRGIYNERPSDVLRMVREAFRMRQLQDITYRTIQSMEDPDEVEVYLAYLVKLRDPLELSMAPSDMLFYNRAGISQVHLDTALREVREAERTGFYKSLVLNDTWKALLRQKMPLRYEQAESRLLELAGRPLTEKVHAELKLLGLSVDDTDAYSNIAKPIWRDMEYQTWEPLTRDFLTSQGLPLPEGAS